MPRIRASFRAGTRRLTTRSATVDQPDITIGTFEKDGLAPRTSFLDKRKLDPHQRPQRRDNFLR